MHILNEARKKRNEDPTSWEHIKVSIAYFLATNSNTEDKKKVLKIFNHL